MQEDPTALTIARGDLQHDLSPWTDDHLRRPDLDEQAVFLFRLEEGNVLGFVVSVREPFAVSGGGFVDGAEGSAQPACGGSVQASTPWN